jgi:hypothetical protein
MSDDTSPREPESPSADRADRVDDVDERVDGAAGEAEWQRRRRLAAVFGDVLPDTTSDERDADASDDDGDDPKDRWLRSPVPPHHG